MQDCIFIFSEMMLSRLDVLLVFAVANDVFLLFKSFLQ